MTMDNLYGFGTGNKESKPEEDIPTEENAPNDEAFAEWNKEGTTVVVKIKPSVDPAVTALQSEVGRMVVYANEAVVTSKDDVGRFVQDLAMMSNLKHSLEKLRKNYVDPLNDFVGSINNTFKTISGPLKSADDLLRAKIKKFNQEAQEAIDKARRAQELVDEARKLQGELTETTGEVFDAVPDVTVPTVEPVTKMYTGAGTLGTRKNWKFEIIDESLIPREWLTPDRVLIGQRVRAKNGVREIPGIRIYPEEDLNITAKRGD